MHTLCIKMLMQNLKLSSKKCLWYFIFYEFQYVCFGVKVHHSHVGRRMSLRCTILHYGCFRDLKDRQGTFFTVSMFAVEELMWSP